MDNVIKVYGYHGTSLTFAQQIITNGFKVSNNDYDWLGTGVYFFQDAPVRAWEWSKQQYPDQPAVIQSIIRLEDCLDLLDITWSSIITESYQSYLEQCQKINQPLPRQTKGAHRLDCAVINYTVGYFEQISRQTVKSIRGVFLEGNPIFPNSYLFERSHVQIAIRDLSLIEQSSILILE
jgi:hypothetical protein